MQFIDYVNECKGIFNKIKEDIHIIIVANKDNESYIINETMDYLLKLCINNDISTDFFLDEKSFITYLQNYNLKKDRKKNFVFNRMHKGAWGERRVLIPSLCKHYNLPYFGHDSYVMGLLCNKSHYSSILNECNIPVPKSWTYDSKYGWLSNEPIIGQKVIIKPIYENNSASITRNSIMIYSELNRKLIHDLSIEYKQPILVQKFISGYELSVPIFSFRNETIIPEVVASKFNSCLKYGDNIINESFNYSRRYIDLKEKFYNFEEVNNYITKNITRDCKKIAKVFAISSLSRFDLRVDDSFSYFFNDLGSIPGFLPNSSFEYVFVKNGFNYNDFLKCTIVSDYIKYYPI